MKRNWKRILAVSLAAAVALAGGLLAWNTWFGGAGEPEPLSPVEVLQPEPIRFAPPDPNPPPVWNYGPDPADFALDEATGIEYVRGIAVVMFERDAGEAQRQAALAASGGEIAGRADMIGKWQLRVPAEDYASLRALCAMLEGMPGVSAAMPDHVETAVLQALPPGDPWTGGIYMSPIANGLWAEINRLPEAWDRFNALTANQAKLGMADAGVNTAHEELTGIVQHVTTINGFTQPAYSYTPVPNIHGTGVAGVMAARAGNGKGGAGVAWDAKVYAVDSISAISGGCTSEQVYYDSILALVREGVSAVNFSIGIITDSNNGTSIPDVHGHAAAQNLWQMLSHGWADFVVVQSAGNRRIESRLNGYFASVTTENAKLNLTAGQLAAVKLAAGNPDMTDAQALEIATEMVLNRILVAGSLERTGASYTQAPYSAFGGVNQLYAPGTNIFVPGTGVSSYQWLTGTSMCAPQFTALAGWMRALNPALSGGMVGALLKLDAVSPCVVRDYGGGAQTHRMLDSVHALEATYTPHLLSRRAEVIVDPDGYILLPEKTTTADLIAALNPVNCTLAYGKAAASLAGTGDQVKVKAVGATGRELEHTYTLVVRGDLNGDGRVDALDAQCLLGYEQGTWEPPYGQEIFELALYNPDLGRNLTAQELFDRGME